MTENKASGKSSQPLPGAPVAVTCTGCPMGCSVTVSLGPDNSLVFTGAQCPRGEAYARQELSNPVRPLTTLIPVPGSSTPLSVKTSQPVPKPLLWDCLNAIHQLNVELPIHMGDILVDNLLGTGIAVLATRSLK